MGSARHVSWLWNGWGKRLLQVRADLWITPPCKHSCSNTFCSLCTPFGHVGSCLLTPVLLCSAQSVQIHRWNYKEGNDSYLLGVLRGHRAEHSTVGYEGLSLLLPSPAWKAEVALGVWKWAEGNQVSQCMESLQSHVRNGFSRLTVELFLDKNGCLEWNHERMSTTGPNRKAIKHSC